MKNLFKMVLSISLLALMLIGMTPGSASASILRPDKHDYTVCALLLGDADVKTKDFFERTEEKLNEGLDAKSKEKVVCGADIQSLYQNYWLEKGFLEEQPLTKQDMHDFVKYSGYSRCLFILVNAPQMEKTKVPTGLFTSVENTRASIEVRAFFADDVKIIKAVSETQNNDSTTSELRAKRGAYTKCIKEISKTIAPLFFK